MEYLHRIDRLLLKWAYQKPFNNNLIIKSLIFIGDGPFWLILLFFITCLGLIFKSESMYQLSIMLMIGMALSNVVFFICKTNIKRKRPYADNKLHELLNLTIDNRDPGHGSKELESFPSGHVLWTTVSVVIISFNLGYVYFFVIGWLIPIMIFLRLHLGVHYPSDTIAGLIIGVISSIITIFISSGLIRLLAHLQYHPWFNYGYSIFVLIYIFIGIKSWLKRV